jgi:hypothetical protein
MYIIFIGAATRLYTMKPQYASVAARNPLERLPSRIIAGKSDKSGYLM